MILYNWPKIFQYTSGDSSEVVSLIAYITYPNLPLNSYDKTYRSSLIDWSGDSFLLHPEKILSNRSKFDDRELAQYVALASFRSFAEYQATTKRSLNLLLAPVPTVLIDNNRLLSRIEDDVFFCWEEITH